MSIGSLASPDNLLLPVWLIWTGISLLLMQFTFAGRRHALAIREPESAGISMFLVPVGMGLFVLWFSVIALWNGLAQKAGVTKLSTEQTALLALIAPTIPAAVGLILLRGRAAREAIGLDGGRVASGVLWGLLGITIAIPVVWWTLEGSLRLWEWLDYKHEDKHTLLSELEKAGATLVRVAIIVAAVIATPIFEELLFRGLLQTSLRRISGSPVVAIFLASFAFAIVHPDWTVPAIFVLSLGIGLCYELSRNLIAAVVMHAAFNAFTIATSGSL